MQISIKKAEWRQYAEAVAVAERSFMELVAPAQSLQGQQSFLQYADIKNFTARQSAGHECFVVVGDGGRIIGMAELRQRRHISMLFVDPEFTGHGIGRALMDHCLTKSRSFFAPKAITLNASDYAMDFYKKMGFRAIGNRKIEDGLASTPMQRVLPAKLK